MSDMNSDSIYVQIKSPCKKRFPSPLTTANDDGSGVYAALFFVVAFQVYFEVYGASMSETRVLEANVRRQLQTIR